MLSASAVDCLCLTLSTYCAALAIGHSGVLFKEVGKTPPEKTPVAAFAVVVLRPDGGFDSGRNGLRCLPEGRKIFPEGKDYKGRTAT
jgi:hypothetical protein